MASYQFNNPNQVRNSLSSENRHGRSKAQMCLHKIIDLIVSSRETSNQSSLSSRIDNSESDLKLNGMRCENRALFGGFDIDLNVTPDDKTETEVSDSLSGVGTNDSPVVVNADVPIVDKTSLGDECDRNLCGSEFQAVENEEESAVVDDHEERELSEITNLQLQSSEIDNNGVSEETKMEDDRKVETMSFRKEEEEEEQRSEGYLGLLIEAANLIFGDDDSESEKPSRTRVLSGTELIIETEIDNRGLKRDNCSAVDSTGDFDEVSPAVLFKRGRRAQVLPNRYRDSVLEPLTRFSRHRSSTVSTKRKSR